MQGRKVLVTGGAGFLGSHLVERLSGRNTVTVLDDLTTGSLRNLGSGKETIRVKRASILKTRSLKDAMAGQEIVYHLAAKTSAAESVAKPQDYWRANIEGTVNILRTAADAGVKRVVFTSSAAVYGNAEESPKVETMRPAPVSPYATTKMVGEFACQEISQLTGMETVVMRVFNAYGPRQDPASSYAGVLAKFCFALASNRPMEIHGDGEQTRDFLYVADVAQAFELAGEKPVAGEVFNVGSGIATSVNEVAHELEKIAAVSIDAKRTPSREGDVRHSLADISKARERLGFAPRISLREGLERTLEYWRATTRRPRAP